MPGDVAIVKPLIDAHTGRLLEIALSHGARTCLHSLSGFLDELGREQLGESGFAALRAARLCTEEMLAANNRLVRLLDVLTADQVATCHQFVAREVLLEVQGIVRAHCAVAYDIHPSLPDRLWGDPDSFRQMLIELVGIVAACGGRELRISLERAPTDDQNRSERPGGQIEAVRPGVDVRCVIYDTGRSLVSLPSFVVDGATSSLERFLLHGLIQRLGGRIHTGAIGQSGQIVTIDLPFGTVPGQVLAVAVPLHGPDPGQDLASLRVLVVEDNEVNLILVRQYLRRLGHRFDTVTEGLAAIREVITGDYDLVLMDRHLPDIDGIEATRRIRLAETSLGRSRTPIVAVTADVSRGHRERCLAAGMDDFISKPFDLERLRDLLSGISAGPVARGRTSGLPDFDAEALRKLVRDLGCDSGTVAEVLRAYLDELPRSQMRVQLAVRERASAKTLSAAEYLRSASQTVGATRLADLCSEIQSSAEHGNLEHCDSLLSVLRTDCQHAGRILGAVEAALLAATPIEPFNLDA